MLDGKNSKSLRIANNWFFSRDFNIKTLVISSDTNTALPVEEPSVNTVPTLTKGTLE